MRIARIFDATAHLKRCARMVGGKRVSTKVRAQVARARTCRLPHLAERYPHRATASHHHPQAPDAGWRALSPSSETGSMDGWQAVADAEGLVAVADAHAVGLSAYDLARLVGAGELIHVCRGWYSLPPPPMSPDTNHPAEHRRRLHAIQARAQIRAFDGRAVASHHSALVLTGLPVFAADLRQVHLTRSADNQSRRRRGLTVHQHVAGSAHRDLVMEVGVAIVQTGVTNGSMAALVAADAAAHRGLVSSEDLARCAALVKGPHVWRVRHILGQVDGRSESPGETRLRHATGAMRLAPTPQFRIEDGAFLAVVDLLLEGSRVVIEFDGFVKYGRVTSGSMAPTPGDVVFAEKTREDRRAHPSTRTHRPCAARLDDPARMVRTLCATRRPCAQQPDPPCTSMRCVA